MKSKWFHISKKLLIFAMAFSWFATSKWVSLFLFGEYPYPEKND